MMSSELSATRLTLKKMGKVRKHEDARDESVLESLVEHRVARVIDAGLGAVGLLGKLFGASQAHHELFGVWDVPTRKPGAVEHDLVLNMAQ